MDGTALYLAARDGHEKVVEMLLKAEAEVNIRDDRGVTALHLAESVGNKEVVMLLKANAKRKLEDNRGGRFVGEIT
jgi:ankyrin repeat protein